MKKLLAVAAMVVTMAGVASAQGGGGGGGGRGMSPEARDSSNVARLFNGITLDAASMAKAKDIVKAAREAMAGVDRASADYAAKQTETNNKRNADLKALLKADADKAKFDENAASMGRGRRGGGE